MSTITAIDVFKAKGLEPEPRLTWAVGAAVRERYRDRFGKLPAKELRTKTAGGGSHCLAVYPESWWPIIADAIDATRPKPAAPDLFGGLL